MNSDLKLLYVAKLHGKRTISSYTKYQDGLWMIEILYPLIARRVWLGPYE